MYVLVFKLQNSAFDACQRVLGVHGASAVVTFPGHFSLKLHTTSSIYHPKNGGCNKKCTPNPVSNPMAYMADVYTMFPWKLCCIRRVKASDFMVDVGYRQFLGSDLTSHINGWPKCAVLGPTYKICIEICIETCIEIMYRNMYIMWVFFTLQQ